MSDGVKNLFAIMKIISTPDVYKYYLDKYRNYEIRYGDMKKQLAEDIVNYLTPIRERILDIYADNDYLRKVVKLGAEKARESASQTLKDVKEIIGFKAF